jgi:hypothetical protein
MLSRSLCLLSSFWLVAAEPETAFEEWGGILGAPSSLNIYLSFQRGRGSQLCWSTLYPASRIWTGSVWRSGTVTENFPVAGVWMSNFWTAVSFGEWFRGEHFSLSTRRWRNEVGLKVAKHLDAEQHQVPEEPWPVSEIYKYCTLFGNGWYKSWYGFIFYTIDI